MIVARHFFQSDFFDIQKEKRKRERKEGQRVMMVDGGSFFYTNKSFILQN